MNSNNRIELPATFPKSDYTPFGYLDNPAHSAVSNPSGVIRSVPPMGFGLWARTVTYGFGIERRVSYLSFLHLSVNINGVSFYSSDDFQAHNVRLVSTYHTKTLMSYDWDYDGVALSAKYYLANENALVCVFEIANRTDTDKTVTVHATNIYGYPGHKYWGCDGVVSVYRASEDVGVSKVWAYGDVFVMGANRHSAAYKATASEQQWNKWMADNDLSANEGALVRFKEGPDHLYTVMCYTLLIPAGVSQSLVLCLAWGVNESFAVREFFKTLNRAFAEAEGQLADDAHFYAHAPLLVGDWPDTWKHGWIYDMETLRMTIRPPAGIYKHHWDGMQIHAPRSVLAEMSLDTMCLSYADMELAKEVIYGTFADALAPNVPCSREDGSVNMTSESASECGTAPNWCFPFLTIRSIYLRDRDNHWIRQLYPYLKAFLEWWLNNRTDEDGWFHADCSWESGQDGSKRFLIDSDKPGASAAFVRTVDIEAAMAHATKSMVTYAKIAGQSSDVEYWKRIADERITHTRAMYVDGWFRDIDARQNKPIIMPDYYDIMMLSPVILGLATAEQIEGIKPKLQYFRENPQHWLEWPPFVHAFAEAAWNVGMREYIAQVLVDIGNRIYTRMDSREAQLTGGHVGTKLPEPYNYRVPGVANEYWPLKVDDHTYPGCENYGWGATLPTLVIRNIIGFREDDDLEADGFILAPALPSPMFQSGKTYGLTNLRYRNSRSDVLYEVKDDGKLLVHLTCQLTVAAVVRVTDESGQVVTQTTDSAHMANLLFEAVNGAMYTITIEWKEK
jgi:hypothetical protein